MHLYSPHFFALDDRIKLKMTKAAKLQAATAAQIAKVKATCAANMIKTKATAAINRENLSANTTKKLAARSTKAAPAAKAVAIAADAAKFAAGIDEWEAAVLRKAASAADRRVQFITAAAAKKLDALGEAADSKLDETK